MMAASGTAGPRGSTWACGLALVLAVGAVAPSWAHEPDEAAKQRMLDGGFGDFVAIGAEHMLTGYDHLLFLLGVLFFLQRPMDIVKFVTAFTVGHTVTLLFGTLAGIRADPYVIDAIIALTVVYKAFENLDGFRRAGFQPPPMLPMVLAFGLIHGLGLSTRLQQMTVSRVDGLVGKILAFNLGVELGQIAALLAMGVVLSLWRSTPGWRRFTVWCNSALIATGVLLFALQAHGYFNQETRAETSARTAFLVPQPFART